MNRMPVLSLVLFSFTFSSTNSVERSERVAGGADVVQGISGKAALCLAKHANYGITGCSDRICTCLPTPRNGIGMAISSDTTADEVKSSLHRNQKTPIGPYIQSDCASVRLRVGDPSA
jgi:hypothetical protein